MAGSAGSGNYHKTCERYDMISGIWEPFESLNEGLIATTAVKFENRFIYLVGGFGLYS